MEKCCLRNCSAAPLPWIALRPRRPKRNDSCEGLTGLLRASLLLRSLPIEVVEYISAASSLYLPLSLNINIYLYL